jgi:hypothetical protein
MQIIDQKIQTFEVKRRGQKPYPDSPTMFEQPVMGRFVEMKLAQHLQLALLLARVACLIRSHVRMATNQIPGQEGLKLDRRRACFGGGVYHSQCPLKRTIVIDACLGNNVG